MNKTSRTAGPWEVWNCSYETPDTYRIVRNARHTDQRAMIAICGSKLDANLIAAAPEMLEALKAASQLLGEISTKTGSSFFSVGGLIDEVIARAEGRE